MIPAFSLAHFSRKSHNRDTVLLSHANSEDNEFTLWLALQLANEGYRVWSDLTKLLGGETFWDDIEAVIRDIAVKVLYVLCQSRSSLRTQLGRSSRQDLLKMSRPCRLVTISSRTFCVSH